MKRIFTEKKKLAGSQTYRKWSDYSEGDVVVGKFVGTHTDNYDKVNPKIKVIHAEFRDGSGEALIGQTLVLNSCGVLDKAMEDVQEGEYIQVVYNGTITMQKGKYAGKEAHTMDVSLVDPNEVESMEGGSYADL